jgi:glycosyltransferase involved in cell wall biosynthesis
MNIVYINGYQGRRLLARRPIVRGLVIAGSFKSEQIAGIFADKGHCVFVIAEGIATERTNRFYRGFASRMDVRRRIPVLYPHSLDTRWLGTLSSRFFLVAVLLRLSRRKKLDIAVIYDLSLFQIMYAAVCMYVLRVPVVIEYEDDGMVDRYGKLTLFNRATRAAFGLIRERIGGCFAVTQRMLDQFPASTPGVVLRGILSNDLCVACRAAQRPRTKTVLFSGGLNSDKGLNVLLDAWRLVPDKKGWDLLITGIGPLETRVRAEAAQDPSIRYPGLLPRAGFIDVLLSSSICANPHSLRNVSGILYPFKMTEYIASGNWVVTTKIAEFDGPVLGCLVTAGADTPREFAEALRRAMEFTGPPPPGPREYVLDQCSEDRVAKRLDALLADARGGAR